MIEKNVHYLMFLYLLVVGPFIAFMVPDQIQMADTWMLLVSEKVATVAPTINKLAALSDQPQVARVFLTVQWAVFFPVWAAIAYQVFRNAFARPGLRERTARLGVKHKPHPWLLVFFAVAFLFVSLNFPLGKDGETTSFITDMTRDSRFWLGFFGSMQILFTAVFAVGGIMAVVIRERRI